MRNIAVRISIAVLTFVMGTVAAFWVESNKPPRATRAVDRVLALPTAPLKEERDTCEQSAPEVKWVFINCTPGEAQGWYNAEVVIFFENGDWVRVRDIVSRNGNEFVFSTDNYYGAEAGRWTVNDDGSFAVVTETQGHFWRDVTETWLIGANEAFLTKQGGRRVRIATRFRQIGYSQLVNGSREDGESPLAIKQLFDPCHIRHAESIAID